MKTIIIVILAVTASIFAVYYILPKLKQKSKSVDKNHDVAVLGNKAIQDSSITTDRTPTQRDNTISDKTQEVRDSFSFHIEPLGF